MQTIEVPLVGPTYSNRALSVGNQLTKNFYIEVNQDELALMPFPGLKPFSVAGVNKHRGCGVYNGAFYVVSGEELHKVGSDGSSTLIGNIPGSNRVVMTEDQSRLVIAVGDSKPYQYDGSTISQATDVDTPSANTVAYINDRVVYDTVNGLAFADLDSPLVVNSANVLFSNTRIDEVVAAITHRQQIYSFGKRTIEPVYFTGSGTPPYSRVNNAVQEVGTESPYSIASDKDFIYFFGHDRQAYRMSGVSSQTITNPAIGRVWSDYSKVDDATGHCFSFDGQRFYLLSFPSEGESWLFNESAGAWSSLGYDVTGGAHLIAGIAWVYDKWLACDRRNGNVYELDPDTFTDNGDTVHRVRTTKAIEGRDYHLPGKQLTMDRLELVIEPGMSLVSKESQVIMQYSDDNGRTWSTEEFSHIGERGEYGYRVEWFCLGSFYKRILRFTMSDAIQWVLVSCNADIEVGVG